MKRLFLIGVLLGAWGQPLPAQSITAMTEQLAALRQLGRTVQEGYQLVRNGLEGIRAVRQSEFDLHSDYFGSLEVVKPAITVEALQELQVKLIRLVQERLAYWRKQPKI